MNGFVDRCRREWKRLGVSDSVADEMAAELEADFRQAEAEGAAAEAVVGIGADPRAFAAAWAAERGVIDGPPWQTLMRSRLPAALATIALVPAIVGAVLMIVAAPADSQQLVSAPSTRLVWTIPAPTVDSALPPRARAQRASTVAILAQERAREASALVLARIVDRPGDDTRTIGSILLIAGLALLVPLTLLWLWVGRRSLAARTV